MKYGFKNFFTKKGFDLSQDLENQMNEFFRTNKHLIPRSVSIAPAAGTQSNLTAIVLYEDTKSASQI